MQASVKADDFEPPPEFGTVLAAGMPFGVERCQLRVERAKPSAEHIGSSATSNLPCGLASIAGCTNNRLYGRSLAKQRTDSLIGILTPLEAFVLETLDACEEFWIGCSGLKCLANGAHRFTDGVEERLACILHQMPAIRNL